jgi:hypothetical protein
MKSGRKSKHNYYSLKLGEKALLKGKAKKYPHQYIRQFNISHAEKLVVENDGLNVFAVRVL